MSISQNSASAEDGLSPALLMIEELSHRELIMNAARHGLRWVLSQIFAELRPGI
jgi:hypothetical protein